MPGFATHHHSTSQQEAARSGVLIYVVQESRVGQVSSILCVHDPEALAIQTGSTGPEPELQCPVQKPKVLLEHLFTETLRIQTGVLARVSDARYFALKQMTKQRQPDDACIADAMCNV